MDRRPRRALKFAQKGKYIQRAEEQRAEQKMEELRQRIAENARKAGLEGEFDTLERSVKVCRNLGFVPRDSIAGGSDMTYHAYLDS